MCHVMYDTYTDYVSRDVWHLYWLCVTGAEVLNQLASMRQQLQQERQRVENALSQQKVCWLPAYYLLNQLH